MRQLSQRFVSPVTRSQEHRRDWVWHRGLALAVAVAIELPVNGKGDAAAGERLEKSPGTNDDDYATASDGNLLLATYPKGFANIILQDGTGTAYH